MKDAMADHDGRTHTYIGVDYNHPSLGGGFGPGYKVNGSNDYMKHGEHP